MSGFDSVDGVVVALTHRRAAASDATTQPAGWLGIVPAQIKVDYQLIVALGGEALKVVVMPRSPAWRAGVRTGDYITSVSTSPIQDLPPTTFLAMAFPPGTTVFIRHRRPQAGQKLGQRIESEATLRLRPDSRSPKWKTRPPVAAGRHVEKDQRRPYVDAMCGNTRISSAAVRVLNLIVMRYDGNAGAYPSYLTIANAVGLKRRQVIELVKRLEWAGVLRVHRGQGFPRKGGRTNVFEPCWPLGWSENVKSMNSADRAALGQAIASRSGRA